MSLEVPIFILILSVPTYFLCKWIIPRLKIGNNKSNKILVLALTAIISPLIYVVIVLIWVFSISYYPTTDFNQVEWKLNSDERYIMSEDLIESEMLIGKTQDEVLLILGTNYSSISENRITYELGFVPGLFKIDPDYLEIRLENGKVIQVLQYES